MSSLIKGVQMEGWRKVGDPSGRAAKYYSDGADEILYMDVVASLYERNNLHEIIGDVASKVFVPITVGGGIDSIDCASSLMKVGADKLAINTAATKDPSFLSKLADTFGSQAVVLNLEAKRFSSNAWTVMTDNGRNHTGLDAVEWAVQACELGVGEILVSSIDRDGTRSGMDVNLIAAISSEVDVPVIGSGGCGKADDAYSAIDFGADAVAVGAALHLDELSLLSLRSDLRVAGYDLRPFSYRADRDD